MAINQNDKVIRQIMIGENPHEIDAKFWGNYDIESLKTINGESILGGGDINHQFIKIEYRELVDLRFYKKLIPGQKYRITDYVTTVSQENTQENTIKSAGHQFDIIVEALSEDTLSENAKAIQNESENESESENDGYFNDSNLEAWELKYCLDNDTDRFSWADDSENGNGKGVIYYMKDEFGNECSYDFKNIQFFFNSTEYDNWKSAVLGNKQYTDAFYTFSYYDKIYGVQDDSLKVYSTPNHYAHGNKVNNYFRNEDGKLTLNNIVFVTTGNSPYNNIIENGCHDCIFGDNCHGNTIGFNASKNVVCNDFYNNKIGNNCLNNIFPRQFYSCECGDNFMHNDFIANSSHPDLSAVINCIFGNNFKKNTGIDVRLSNIEILDNTLNNTLPDKVKWDDIIVDNGKNINKCLSDYKNYFKLFIGLDENKRVFLRDFNEQCIYHMGNFTNLQEALQEAAIAKIAGNISLSKISFTIGRIDNSLTATNEGLQTGYIEQYVSENVSTQVIIWKSGFRMRKITFTDNNRIEINPNITTDSIKNGDANSEGVYWSNPTSLYYDQASHKIALTRFDDGQKWGLDACFGEVEIPLVNDSRAGLMSSDDKSILTNLNKIVKSKVYNSLPLPKDDDDEYDDEYENYLGKKYWYRFARINDKSPNIFRISTNAANDVIFTSSIAWSNGSTDYDKIGALSVINCSMKSNPNHACIEGIRLVASPKGGYIDMLLNTPLYNSNAYVEIYVTCISTISNEDNLLYDTIVKLEEKGAQFVGDSDGDDETIIQSFDLVDMAMMSKDFYFTNENGDQISVADSIVNKNISYRDLKDLRDNNKLIPGQKYRITDYLTTTSQENTIISVSAGHQFDIIVEALSENTLSEDAKAIQNENENKNEGYFKDSNLEAWELKYCLDNDTSRFAWVDDSENGRGVIYYMKDEFNNECPYDFKNIQFRRYKLDPPKIIGYGNEGQNQLCENVNKMFVNNLSYIWHGSNNSSNNNGYCWDGENGVVFSELTGEEQVFYTFSNVTVYDDEIIVTDKSLTNVCYSNVIKENYDENDENKVLKLNNNIFFSEDINSFCYSNTFGNNCYSNSFGNNCTSNTFGNNCTYNSFGNNCTYNSFGNNCYSNSFGNNCYSNSFGNSCTSNSFGNSCTSNTFGVSCGSNSFGNFCYSNSFGNFCTSNTFGVSCGSNSFGIDCINNSFGDSCTSNSFGDSCGSNSFGNSCTSNSFGIDCINNSFGDSCGSNSFGDSCKSNSFGNSCTSNSFGDSCSDNGFYTNESKDNKLNHVQYVTLNEGCHNLLFYTSEVTNEENKVQNITVTKGVKSLSLKIPIRNNEYELKIARNSNGDIKMYCEADLIK